MNIVRNRWTHATVVVVAAAGVILLLWWRGPAWGAVGDVFRAVEWKWVAAAVGLNLLSVLVRALAWRTVIVQAFDPPHPSFMLVFSAFSIGLFANAILPGRIGELARVAVLNRRMKHEGAWARLLGTVFAHRVFDLVSVMALIVYVVITAHIPDWAVTSLIAVVAAGVVLFSVAIMGARSDHYAGIEEGLSAVRKVIRLARYGLSVMRKPGPAALALFFQLLGWTFQLFAVYTAMRAFGIHEGLPAAGVVLVLMNVATIFPLWPGNVGLVQALQNEREDTVREHTADVRAMIAEWENDRERALRYERELVPAIFEPWAPLLVAKAALHEGEHALDVACGTGVVTRLAAAQLGSRGHMVGLDLNPGEQILVRGRQDVDAGLGCERRRERRTAV